MSDPFDLQRFVSAQEDCYARALAEVRAGDKQSHWMWYIFPQVRGLGFSATSKRYAIQSLDEARAYLAHPVLGPRLLEIAEAALAVPDKSAFDIFGTPDDDKLKSCATLFALVTKEDSVFYRLLDRFFDGQRDAQTFRQLGLSPGVI